MDGIMSFSDYGGHQMSNLILDGIIEEKLECKTTMCSL